LTVNYLNELKLEECKKYNFNSEICMKVKAPENRFQLLPCPSPPPAVCRLLEPRRGQKNCPMNRKSVNFYILSKCWRLIVKLKKLKILAVEVEAMSQTYKLKLLY
jgi:hypothetical protein